MWTNLQFPAIFSHLPKKFLTEYYFAVPAVVLGH